MGQATRSRREPRPRRVPRAAPEGVRASGRYGPCALPGPSLGKGEAHGGCPARPRAPARSVSPHHGTARAAAAGPLLTFLLLESRSRVTVPNCPKYSRSCGSRRPRGRCPTNTTPGVSSSCGHRQTASARAGIRRAAPAPPGRPAHLGRPLAAGPLHLLLELALQPRLQRQERRRPHSRSRRGLLRRHGRLRRHAASARTSEVRHCPRAGAARPDAVSQQRGGRALARPHRARPHCTARAARDTDTAGATNSRPGRDLLPPLRRSALSGLPPSRPSVYSRLLRPLRRCAGQHGAARSGCAGGSLAPAARKAPWAGSGGTMSVSEMFAALQGALGQDQDIREVPGRAGRARTREGTGRCLG